MINEHHKHLRDDYQNILPCSLNRRVTFFVPCSTVHTYSPYGFVELDALNTREFLCNINVMLIFLKVKNRSLLGMLGSTPHVSIALPPLVTSTDKVKFRNPKITTIA